MYREFFVHSPVLVLPIISLLIFITVFAGIVGAPCDAARRPSTASPRCPSTRGGDELVSSEIHQPGSASTGAPITSTKAAKGAYEDKVVHAYDDIEEFDNHLPNWWLVTLYGAVVFAIGYWFHYEVFHSGPTSNEAYEQSVAVDRRAAAARARAAGAMTDDALVTLSHDTASVAAGQQIFTTNCVACHAANAGGIIGPNLTDNAWIHGGRPTQIFQRSSTACPPRAWSRGALQLGMERVQNVVAYVLTLRNTNVAGGKAPQGDVFTE